MHPSRRYLLAKITTDDGLVGWGQCGTTGAPEIALMLLQRLRPLLIGEDPCDRPKFWERWLNSPLATLSEGHKGAESFAISGVDIALWDILGKACNKPIHKLIGGYQDKIRLYASHGDPDKFQFYLDNGFTGFKIGISHPGVFPGKVGTASEIDFTLKKLRDIIGYENDLMVDAWQGFSLSEAIRVAKVLEKYEITWFEEPILSYDFDGLAAISRSTTVPIAAGEHQYMNREAADLILKSGIQLVQCDPVSCGGISESYKIASIAQSRGVRYQPHCTETPVNFATVIQVMASAPNSFLAEWQVGHGMGVKYGEELPLRWELIKQPFSINNGWVDVPKGPGLGIEIDERALKKFEWKIF